MRNKRIWKQPMALMMGAILLLLTPAGAVRAEKVEETVAEEMVPMAGAANKAGFDIQNGVLLKYSGKAANVTIPEGVTSIGGSAFARCSSLRSVTIPEGVTSIGWDAFSGCSNLTNITIPESVTNIEVGAFFDTPWLENERAKNPLVIINKILVDAQTCKGDVIIPEEVTSIGAQAFMSCGSLTGVTLPTGVTSIGDNAFYGCSSLTSMTIPEGVTSIGALAFGECSSLTSVAIPKGVTGLEERVFDHCENLRSVAIPEGVTVIGDGAFMSCSSLTSVALPESVTRIEDGAFISCRNLTSVTIPEGVTSIGNMTFFECTKLTIYGKKNSYAQVYAKEKKIPFTAQGMSKISAGAYNYKFTGTSEVAFAGIKSGKNVKAVIIPASVKIGGKSFKVTSVASKALQKNAKITSVTVGTNVKTIGENAFNGCKKLKSITIKSTKLKKAGKNAFKGISQTAKIKVPKAKLKAYQKLLKGKGQGKKVKITK